MAAPGADLGETGVHVCLLELHAQFSGFKHAVGQEILDEVLQTLPAGKHVLHHFALALVEKPKFLTLQQFDVAIQDG